MPADLVGFLRDRLDTEAQVAREAMAADWRNAPTSSHYEDAAGPSEAVFTALPDTDLTVVARTGARGDRAAMVNAEHIARHDPARTLAEVDAKRRIIEAHPISTNVIAPQPGTPAMGFGCETCHDWSGYTEGLGYCDTLRLLALPHREHPNYWQEWAL